MEKVILAVIAILGGGIGSLFAPWANWGIEKRKQKLEHRRALISTWRVMIKAVHKGPPINNDAPALHLGDLLLRYDWATLKPHLSQEALQHFQDAWNSYCYGQMGGREIDLLTDEVGRIDKEWGLV